MCRKWGKKRDGWVAMGWGSGITNGCRSPEQTTNGHNDYIEIYVPPKDKEIAKGILLFGCLGERIRIKKVEARHVDSVVVLGRSRAVLT